MKIGLALIVGAFGFSLFQHGCGNAKISNQTSANNQNTAVVSANFTPSNMAVGLASLTPVPDSVPSQNPNSPNDGMSYEEGKPFLELQERCEHTPVSVNRVVAMPLSGPAPLKVTFDGSSAYDPDGTKIVKWEWHFGNGQSGEGRKTTYIYDKPGKYGIALDVTDSQGQKTSDCSDLGTGIVVIVTDSETKDD